MSSAAQTGPRISARAAARAGGGWISALVVVASAASAAAADDAWTPFGPGPCSVVNWDVGNMLAPLPEVGMHLGVYAPVCGSASAPARPLLLFMTSFAGDTPEEWYSEAMTRVASQGVFVLAADRMAFPDPASQAAVLNQTIAWIATNFSATLPAHGVVSTPDLDSGVGFWCHSAACHTMVYLLNTTCSLARAVVMVDPVDGMDPWGMMPVFIINPPNPVPFAIPALHIETGFDPAVASPDLPPCAPANLSNSRFYDAWQGPIWQLNATQFGHMDWLDSSISGMMSGICPSGANSNKTAYQTAVAGWTTAFTLATLAPNNTNLLPYFSKPTLAPVAPVLAQQNLHGYEAGVPFCTRK